MRILIVEDEHRIALALKKGLEQEHFVVDTSFTGPEGLDMAVTEEYDIIILDLMLPGMDGMNIARELRRKNIHTPILMLTARGQIRDKLEGFDAGADDYLTKPFSFEELLARIGAITRRPKVVESSVLTVETLELDLKLYKVKRNGKEIILSNKEFSLLQYLMRNPNRILSKQDIMSHVWDYDADILPNTVEAYIRNLRNKVDRPFIKLPPLIHTIRGFGYKIGI